MSPIPREELKRVLLSLTDIASAVIMPYFRQPIGIDNKQVQDEGYDPVTIADRNAETAIREEIARIYPDHAIKGEEFADKLGTANYSWVIDPIDGTRGFVCGLPTWATLIGVCHEGEPIIGVMSQPLVGDVFIGGMGNAELHSRGKISALSAGHEAKQSLKDSVLFATTPDMFSASELTAFESLSRNTRMTRFGVDSYAYCLLAAGYIDLVVESGLGFYDIAALIPIIEAAGGIVTNWDGQPVREGGRVIAAANTTLHQQALSILQAAL